MNGDAFSHLPDPMKIYQEHLDALSEALLNRNFSAFARRMAVPNVVVTETNKTTIKSKDEMAVIFYALHASLKSQRVTQYLRIARHAEYKECDHICGEHETHIFSSGQRIVEPYPNRVRLELMGTEWIETASSNAVTNFHAARNMPRVSANPVVQPLPQRQMPGNEKF